MSEEQDYIIVTVDEDGSEDNNDIVIIEDSETELTENTVSTDGMLTVQPHFQGSSDNYQLPSQMSCEVEGLAGLGNQPVSQMNHPANLKRCNPNAAEAEFTPLNKKGQSSIPKKDDKEGNASGFFCDENYRKQLKELQHYCEGLQDLIKSTGRQVYQLCGIVAKIQHPFEEPSLPNSAFLAACRALLPKGEPNLANIPEMMNYSAFMGNNSVGPDNASSSLCIPPKLAENFTLIKIPEKEETSLENSPQTMHYPASLGISGSDTNSFLSLPPYFGMSAKAQTSMEYSSQTMHYPTLLGNNSGLATASSPLSISPNFEMLVKRENLENSTEMVNNLPFMENDNGQDTPQFFNPSNVDLSTEVRSETVVHTTSVENGSGGNIDSESFFLTPSYALVPIKILVKAGSRMENNCSTTYPAVLENNNGQNSFLSSSVCFTSSSGFLGDPKRNVSILDFHLMMAQRKAEPKHAARYLVRVLFSNEALIGSSVDLSSYPPIPSGCQLLDPNKMAAIREYLATIFPNHDLRECGKDWKTCISYINCLIRYLCHCNTRRTPGNTVVNNQVPANPNTPAFAGLNDKHGDGGESSSHLSQQAAASETKANGNSQQNSSALPEGFIEPSTHDSEIPFEALKYVGNPSRNVQVPYAVLTTAKAKPRPDLSARYLIRNLFPEEVLIRSNVRGSATRGIYALNPNRISALREFLQDNYPNSDLREAGYDWKLCVASINSCIRSVRYELNRSTLKSQPLPAMTPSIKSEPEDD